MAFRTFAGLVVAAALAGCNILPTYAPAPDQKTTDVVLLGPGVPFMCYHGGRFQLPTENLPEETRLAKVPTGARVTLWRHMSYQGYQVISTCRPAVSFIPQPGQRYIVNAGLNGNRCFIEAVREDSSTESGIAPEFTLGAPTC